MMKRLYETTTASASSDENAEHAPSPTGSCDDLRRAYGLRLGRRPLRGGIVSVVLPHEGGDPRDHRVQPGQPRLAPARAPARRPASVRMLSPSIRQGTRGAASSRSMARGGSTSEAYFASPHCTRKAPVEVLGLELDVACPARPRPAPGRRMLSGCTSRVGQPGRAARARRRRSGGWSCAVPPLLSVRAGVVGVGEGHELAAAARRR